MSTTAGEKRDFLRVPFLTDVKVTCGAMVIRGNEEIAVSMKGLDFAAADPLPAAGENCTVAITIATPDQPVVIKAEGRVVRSGSGHLAIEFTGLELDGYQHLRNLILHNADDPERAEKEFIAHWGIRKRPPAAG